MALFSCKAQMVEKGAISGTFYKLKKRDDFNIAYTLELRHDNTFKLLVSTAEGKPQCEGKWEIVDNEFILLECDIDENPYETVTNTYMSQKTHKLQVLGKNRLKYNDVILRRKR